jgi:hydroxymethylbilane synthase
MDKRKIVIGSRDSKLAIIQSEIVMKQIKRYHPEIELELITMKTTGDLILDRSLDKIGGKGLFVKELDMALLDGVIDISIHSLKDMPAELSKDLPIIAVSEREDPRDAFVLPNGVEKFDINLPVGCSSARRKNQIEDLMPGIIVEPVRGNVQTRLQKLDDGKYGALILAHAGLIRLSLQNRVSRIFSTEEMIPSGGQGILAIQGRKGENTEYLMEINNLESQDATLAERQFIKTLDGGCSSPIAVYAEIAGNEIRISGLYVDLLTGNKVRGNIKGDRSQAEKLGYELAMKLLREVK